MRKGGELRLKLTAIDESVVIGFKRLLGVSLFLENDGGISGRFSGDVILECACLDRSDSGGEKVLDSLKTCK